MDVYVYGEDGQFCWAACRGEETLYLGTGSFDCPLPVHQELNAIFTAAHWLALNGLEDGAVIRTRSRRVVEMCLGQGKPLSDQTTIEIVRRIREQIGGMRFAVAKAQEISARLAPERCACGKYAYRYAPDGTPLCRAHAQEQIGSPTAL
jgi:hypothetical protein